MQQAAWEYTTNCRIPNDEQIPVGINRYAAVVSYDGHDYSGFQKQRHSPSVQSALEIALSTVANEAIVVSCAGRTDAGVHASYQVVHFDSLADRSARNWVMGCNSQLPNSISLVWAGRVDPSFHARFSALSRTYRYIMIAQETRPAILSSGITWVRGDVDLAAIRSACHFLLGEQDFTAFRASGCQSVSPFRNVHDARIYASGELMVFEITANAFVLHMVRNIVGSLLEIGLRRQPAEWISDLLRQKDRSRSAPTASPNGLYLVHVDYDSKYALPDIRRGPFFVDSEDSGDI
jgi:tRNA pseudouridine38-40 synthase